MNTVAVIGRLLVSLAAVLLVMWLIARRMRKGGRAKDSRLIDVLGRQQLSRTASVAVVRVGDQALVIGVTDTQVSVLGETDLGAAQAMLLSAEHVKEPRRANRAAAGSDTPGEPSGHRKARATSRAPGEARGGLSGSALSPQTWRQALDSLRDLTTRSR